MLFAIFDFDELQSKNDENLSFASLLIQDLHSVILTSDKIAVDEWLRQKALISSWVTIENVDSIKTFLDRNKNNSNDCFLIVSDKIIDCRAYGDHIARCSYVFNGIPSNFQNQSFTEHAQNKILYNELSWLYLDSIANDTAKEVAFLKTIFDEHRAKKILDCCCGVGRHAARLADLGFTVTGLDASKAQINTAQLQNNNPNVEYFVSDARSFLLPDKNYDAAICMWTTYNYFSRDEDLEKVLQRLWEHLCQDGLLILDSKNIPILAKERLYHRTTRKKDLNLTLLIYKRVTDSLQMSRYFYFLDIDGKKSFYLDEEFVRFYSLEELQKLTRSTFKLIGAYGDFNGNLFNENKSERMITVWKKICYSDGHNDIEDSERREAI